MKFLKKFNENDIFKINTFKVDNGTLKVVKSSHGWNCNFSCENGKGRSTIMDNTSKVVKIDMNDDEMFLFGIDCTPTNSGVGRLFINAIFDYFKISKIYLPSNENHPVWNKIATKTNIKIDELTIFTLTKKKLNNL